MPNPSIQPTLRQLPSVAELIDSTTLRDAAKMRGQNAVTTAAREVVEQLRKDMQAGHCQSPLPSREALVNQIETRLAASDAATLRAVINATGILLHTGLGRAPLASEAIEAMQQVARGYCNVELDLPSGQRSQRSQAVAGLISELTGAEAAHVVNNNAGATGLAVAALAAGRELIVAHGELIEIGGGYRIPDVITSYGAKLRPVGTTNRTRTGDYAAAVGEQTAAILVVHPSNYQVVGFTESPPLEELAALARQHAIPLIHDIGSGALVDFAQFGCQGEPVAAESIRSGSDLVLFSGDKLVGGPQSGILAGRRDLIDRILVHPLSRALRVDKTTLAALDATLRLYRHPERALRSIPLLRFLNTPLGELRKRAQQLASQLQNALPAWEVEAAPDQAFVGGGSLPHQAMASWSVAIRPAGSIAPTESIGIEALSKQLRMGRHAVVGRIQQDQLLLCLHGVFPAEDEALVASIIAADRGLLK